MAQVAQELPFWIWSDLQGVPFRFLGFCYSSYFSHHCGQTLNKKQLKGKTNFISARCSGVRAIKAGKQFNESGSGW